MEIYRCENYSRKNSCCRCCLADVRRSFASNRTIYFTYAVLPAGAVIPAGAVLAAGQDPGLLPLPIPQRGGSLGALRSFLNLPGEDDFVLVAAWLLATLRHGGEMKSYIDLLFLTLIVVLCISKIVTN